MDFVHRVFGAGAHTAPRGPGVLVDLKAKYGPALSRAEAMGVRLESLRLQGERLVIEAIAPSRKARDTVLEEIDQLDPNHSDLDLEIRIGAT